MKRKLRVSYAPGPRRDFPYIRLKGHWLKDCGIDVGDTVVVEPLDSGTIKITKLPQESVKRTADSV